MLLYLHKKKGPPVLREGIGAFTDMIKNIVFDMGGVLIDYNPEKNLASLEPDVREIAIREIFRNNLWSEKDRGTVSAEEIWELKGGLIPEESRERVKSMVMNLYPYMPPFPDMPGLVARLRKKGYGIFLLSNASLDFYENKKNIPALELFDGYIVSADYQLIKPEPGIYEKLREKFGLNLGECVFIDDVQENVQAAVAAGMQALRFEGSIEKLENQLRELGVNI